MAKPPDLPTLTFISTYDNIQPQLTMQQKQFYATISITDEAAIAQ